MKLNTKHVIFGCVLLLVLLLIMSASCGAMPYESVTRPYAFFEGLTTVELDTLKRDFDKSTNELLGKLDAILSDADKTKYNLNAIRTKGSYDAKQVKMFVDKVMHKADKSTESYKLLQTYIETKLQPMLDVGDTEVEVDVPHPKEKTKEGFTAESKNSLDIFINAVGNQKCSSKASGMSNSMGALCLSEEQLYLLQSRGGNSTGRDSQIG